MRCIQYSECFWLPCRRRVQHLCVHVLRAAAAAGGQRCGARAGRGVCQLRQQRPLHRAGHGPHQRHGGSMCPTQHLCWCKACLYGAISWPTRISGLPKANKMCNLPSCALLALRAPVLLAGFGGAVVWVPQRLTSRSVSVSVCSCARAPYHSRTGHSSRSENLHACAGGWMLQAGSAAVSGSWTLLFVPRHPVLCRRMPGSVPPEIFTHLVAVMQSLSGVVEKPPGVVWRMSGSVEALLCTHGIILS